MSTSEEKYYTYILANPLKNGQYFYIGVSSREKRLYEHLKCSKQDKNYHKKNTIKEIQNANSEIIFIKVLENVDIQTAINEEIRLISIHGRRDLGTGILTNMSKGGEGASSFVWKNEAKEQLSELMKGENNPRYNTIMINDGKNNYISHPKTESMPEGYHIGGRSLKKGIHEGKRNGNYNKISITDNKGTYITINKTESIPEGWIKKGKPKPIGCNKGENHPRYNTMQINDGNGKYKTIKKNENIPEGWVKGGKPKPNPDSCIHHGKNNPMYGKTGKNNPNYGKKDHINIKTFERRRLLPEDVQDLDWILYKIWKTKHGDINDYI